MTIPYCLVLVRVVAAPDATEHLTIEIVLRARSGGQGAWWAWSPPWDDNGKVRIDALRDSERMLHIDSKFRYYVY